MFGGVWCLFVCLFVLVVAVLAVLAVVDLAGCDCASDPRKNTDKLHAETWQKAHQFRVEHESHKQEI